MRNMSLTITYNPSQTRWEYFKSDNLNYQFSVNEPFPLPLIEPSEPSGFGFNLDLFLVDHPNVALVYLELSDFPHNNDVYLLSARGLGFGNVLYYESPQALSEFSGITVGSTDLTPILTAITTAKDEILNFVPTIDLTLIDASLTTIKGYTDTLESDLTIIKTGLDSVLKDSLNGNGSEFIDGTEVLVNGRTLVYTVARSYMATVRDNAYIIVYDLTSSNGSKLTAPEELLTQYVAPVVTP